MRCQTPATEPPQCRVPAHHAGIPARRQSSGPAASSGCAQTEPWVTWGFRRAAPPTLPLPCSWGAPRCPRCRAGGADGGAGTGGRMSPLMLPMRDQATRASRTPSRSKLESDEHVKPQSPSSREEGEGIVELVPPASTRDLGINQPSSAEGVDKGSNEGTWGTLRVSAQHPHRILSADDNWLSMTGFPANTVVGSCLRVIYCQGTNPNAVDALLQASSDGGEKWDTIYIGTQRGEPIHVAVHALPPGEWEGGALQLRMKLSARVSYKTACREDGLRKVMASAEWPHDCVWVSQAFGAMCTSPVMCKPLAQVIGRRSHVRDDVETLITCATRGLSCELHTS
eukprot:CAMPEP_0169482106 /NCGR_PEP_ID=MMETSP1042-20121227/30497_1 /TAXON_ID=464988 /ORGANISM="Hemiselmis andersenii, Strain CCMP1180" /LENGTH=339 /DNA_ID=CAMNT_0009596949 /DNA_START=48 /DNA_END=1064 /DNA_ORIENTATION=+